MWIRLALMLFGSRKVNALIAWVVTAILARHNILLPPEWIDTITAIFGAYILGQGAADFGKEREVVREKRSPWNVKPSQGR